MSETTETTPEVNSASKSTLEKAWDRAKPVLKTAAGGALVIGAASLSRVALTNWNWGADIPANLAMGRSLLIGAFMFPSALLAGAGASLMKEPVRDAFNYLKTRFGGENK